MKNHRRSQNEKAGRKKFSRFNCLAKDLGYGNSIELMFQLEEVSKLLEGYSNAILNSVS
jgi:hypothetical protein